jgi:hypothetical protein
VASAITQITKKSVVNPRIFKNIARCDSSGGCETLGLIGSAALPKCSGDDRRPEAALSISPFERSRWRFAAGAGSYAESCGFSSSVRP